MSKTMAKNDKQTIYEIFRACRLCGAGGGYKMPIIQNVVNIGSVELRQKIRECVQIEVHQDDKMPPLICELCIDKVNDFYEFAEMCKQINQKTRQRLGLPPQTASDGDCILGVTEPVFANHDSDDEPLTRPKNEKKSSKSKKISVKPEKTSNPAPSKPIKVARKRSPTPPRRALRTDPGPLLSKTPVAEKSKSKTVKTKVEEKPSSLKRKQPAPPAPAPLKKPKAPPTPTPEFECAICKFRSPVMAGIRTHMRVHTVTYTDPKLSCNACGEWFVSGEAARSHHRSHGARKPYHCTVCYGDFDTMLEFNSHFSEIPCKKFTELPDKKCGVCWREFPTQNILDGHRCPGEDGRPGGRCDNCARNYSTLRGLRKHTCHAKKKKSAPTTSTAPSGSGGPDPALLARLQTLQIRVQRCDPLLQNRSGDHYDVGDIYGHWGTDLECYYPYKYANSFTTELTFFGGMLNITEDAKKQISNDYVHWDSDEDNESDKTVQSVDKLSNIVLQTLLSDKCTGKVPKRSRVEKDAFGEDEDFSHNFDSLIDSLNDSAGIDAVDTVKSVENGTDLEISKDVGDVKSLESDSVLDGVVDNYVDSIKENGELEDDTALSMKLEKDIEDASNDKEDVEESKIGGESTVNVSHEKVDKIAESESFNINNDKEDIESKVVEKTTDDVNSEKVDESQITEKERERNEKEDIAESKKAEDREDEEVCDVNEKENREYVSGEHVDVSNKKEDKAESIAGEKIADNESNEKVVPDLQTNGLDRIDDGRKLMDELDAQIGKNVNEDNGLDNISDEEFNFDA